MATKLSPPDSFDFTNPQRWPDWLKRFQRFRTATKLDKEGGDVQVSTLIYAMGPEAEVILDRFKLSEADQVKFDVVVKNFDTHFKPNPNYIHEHAVFHKRKQEEGENVESFIRALFEMAGKCDFKDLRDVNIRDRLVVGLKDHQMSQELQLRSDLTLDKAIEIARQQEQVKQQLTEQATAQHQSLEEVKKKQKPPNFAPQPKQDKFPERKKSYGPNQGKPRCGKCDKVHEGNRCPAANSECRRCHRRGHWAICCRTRMGGTNRSVREVTQHTPESFFLGGVSVTGEKNPWLVTLPIQGQSTTFKVDCGADVTVISKDTYDKMPIKPQLVQSRDQLMTAADAKLHCHGSFKTKFRYKGKHFRDTMYVADSSGNLLSRKMCTTLDIITLNISECKTTSDITDNEIFGEIGLVKGDPVKIELREGVTPFHLTTARRV